MAHINAYEIKDRIDALNVKSGDVVSYQDFILVIDTVQVAMGGDVLLCGNARGTNSLYNVSPGDYICWGPKGMATTLTDYLNHIFLGRKP